MCHLVLFHLKVRPPKSSNCSEKRPLRNQDQKRGERGQRLPVQQHFLSCPHVIWSPKRRYLAQTQNRQTIDTFPPDKISSQRWTPDSVTWGQVGGFLGEPPKEISNSSYPWSIRENLILASNSKPGLSSFFTPPTFPASLQQHRIHSLWIALGIAFQLGIKFEYLNI